MTKKKNEPPSSGILNEVNRQLNSGIDHPNLLLPETASDLESGVIHVPLKIMSTVSSLGSLLIDVTPDNAHLL